MVQGKTPKSSFIVGVLLLIAIFACSGLILLARQQLFLWLAPPPRFPQFDEQWIAGPASYGILRWSPDGRYLAFMNEDTGEIVVHDFSSKNRLKVIHGASNVHFDWDPFSRLSYLKYRPDLSGSPFPAIYDLYRIDLGDKDGNFVTGNLHSAGDFAWFKDGHKLVILLAEAELNTWLGDVYLLDVTKGSKELLITRQELNINSITTIALSPDETKLAIYSHRKLGDTQLKSLLIIYDLKTRQIIQEVDLNQMFTQGDLDEYHRATFGDEYLTFIQVEGEEWIVGNFHAFKGECYNYAIFFLNVNNPSRNFCIPTDTGAIADASISPDLSKIAYLTVASGLGRNYVMVANLIPEYRARLDP